MGRASGDELEITLYLVGDNEEDARGNFPFDSFKEAEQYKYENNASKIYSVIATIDFSTMEAEDGQ